MLTEIPEFTAPSYGDRTLNQNQLCVNLFPEKTPGGWQLVSTAGFSLAATSTNNLAPQGAYIASTGQIFLVNGTVVYEWDGAVYTSRGTVSFYGSSNIVYMADNGTQLFIVEPAGAGFGYTLTMSAGSVTVVADVNFPASPTMVTFQDGYFIVSKGGTGEFYLSKLYDGTSWTPVQFATAESKGDRLVGLYSNGTTLYLFGEQTVEMWYNTGNSSFPFERINGSTLQIGCASASSISGLNGDVFFLGASTGGRGGIFKLSGTTITRVSTPFIENILQNATAVEITSYCISMNGHSIYRISVSGAGTEYAFCYDILQGTWFQGDSNVSGSYMAFLGRFAIASGAVTYLLDRYNGKLYSSRTTTNSEAGTAIRRQRIFGPIESNTKKVFHYQIRIEGEIQFDSAGTTSISASLDWTDDDGLTYSTALTMTKTVTSSTTGQRVVWTANRLGASACRYYRLILTGPAAQIVLKKCEIDLQEGRF